MLWWIIASIILIIWIFFTAKLWFWIYKTAFNIQQQKKIIFLSLFVWGIAAWSILLFPKISAFFWLESFTNFTFSVKTALIFMGYLNLISILAILLFWKFSKKQFLNLFVFNVYFLLLYFILSKLNIERGIINIMLYYLFVAFWEELVKNQLAFSLNNKFWVLPSDLMLYHILVAIGFAFWENIVYLIWVIWFQTFILTLFWWLWIVITRWLIWFWAHTFYSWLIWFGNLLSVIWLFFFILLGILIHYGYNLSIYFGYKIVIPIFLILIYFWISWLFYKIDRLYIES